MPRLSFLLVGLFCANAVVAHPSATIVITSSGDVFYSDLERIWQIPRNGVKRVAVPNVHTHELALDPQGRVIGEDSQWLGGDRYRHRIWVRSATGAVTDLVPWTDGFWRSYGLTRDAAGATYWVRCTPERVCTVFRQDARGRVSPLTREGAFVNPVNWIAATPNGDVFVIDGPDLRRVDARGQVTTVVRLSRRTDDRHALMGLSHQPDGNLYVAGHADRKVLRITPAGRVDVVATSTAPWAPSAVARSTTGELWILEWSGTTARVRQVRRDGRSVVH